VILFIFNLFCEYTNLACVIVPVVYRVNQAEYAIHIRVVASQEYVNTYSTRRCTSAVWRRGRSFLVGGVPGLSAPSSQTGTRGLHNQTPI